MKKIWAFGVAVVLVIIIWGGFFSQTASSQQVESRLSNLEADFNRLESQLNRIEVQLNQGRPSARTPNTITPQPPGSRRNMTQQERDRMFDRLATLIIELRQDVNKLQARVSKLESR
jgi:outer membrane murein-binding lipoprotein Lpp